VSRLARSANIPMPEVGVYRLARTSTRSRPGPDQVPVARRGLERAPRADGRGETEACLGHEITHIANGDMVTMTLLQGVVNAFAMFLSRVIAWAITQGRRSDDDERSYAPSMMTYMVQMAIEMVLLFLGSLLVMAFSRWREYRADAGSARIAGRENMIAALQRLRGDVEIASQVGQPAVQTLRISSPGGMALLLMSHPPLEKRIERLQQYQAET
jgi:heat shock protein HtpX